MSDPNVDQQHQPDHQQQQPEQQQQQQQGGGSAGGGQFGKLFIGQVPAVCTEEMLHPLFAPYGTIVEIKVMRDTSQRSKGCAWVRYENQAQAQAAIDALHEKHTIPPQVNTLQVRYAHTSHANNGGGGGGGGGGRGGGRGRGGGHRGGGGHHMQQPAYHQQSAQQVVHAGGAGGNGETPPSYTMVQNNPYAALWPGGAGSFASSGNGSFGNMGGYTQMHWPQYQQGGGGNQQPKMQASPPGTSVFVGNLPPNLDQDALRTLITDNVQGMNITNVSIHRDRRFGFVTFETAEGAALAAQNLNGFEVYDRKIRVEVTQNEAKRTNAGGGGQGFNQGGYGGGYGGGGRGGGGYGGYAY